MSLNVVTGTVISVDSKGIIEYWDGDSLLPVSKPDVNFEYKSETDLYDLAKVYNHCCKNLYGFNYCHCLIFSVAQLLAQFHVHLPEIYSLFTLLTKLFVYLILNLVK